MSSSDSSDSAFFSSFFLSATKNQIKPSNRKNHYRLYTWKLVPIKNVLTSCICLNLLQVRILLIQGCHGSQMFQFFWLFPPRLNGFTIVTLGPFLTCCFGVSQGSLLKAVLSSIIVYFLNIETWMESWFNIKKMYDRIRITIFL